ncbi:hypothetical protein TRFO_33499 [Tritrichomonas foetus]|uniref:Right handed beta helix domain-containing protein n=1 Tax=Tritrichomonas foetus TaxID=1144522 RepID=A0A1J4JNG2_9EUKA|nr:hypothetical protein TRFO_33499 [Tritrichomonas foetus]|eukprot:OHS99975.1 hypothetical protein TRFO_33499 [Tritrichomonas foetus]
MIIVFTLISTQLHIINEGNSTNCTENNPCNYNHAMELLDQQEIIFFHDQIISEPEHIKSFRLLASKALSKGISIQGTKTLIIGSSSEFYKPAFISFENSKNTFIEGFIFSEFHSSIIQTRSSNSFSIKNCLFQENHIDKKLSLLIFSHSSIILKNTNITLCTIHDSSLISTHMSSIFWDSCIIDNVFSFHISDNPLFLMIETNLSILATIFIRNNSPYSPLFTIIGNSNVLVINSTFSSNQNTELFQCDSIKHVNFTNSLLYDNQGTVISTIEGTLITLNNSKFHQNFSPVAPLFTIHNSSLSIYENCQFLSNSAIDFFLIDGENSLLSLNNSKFIGNHLFNSLIHGENYAKIEIENCFFEKTQSKNFVIGGIQISVNLLNSSFSESFSPVLSVNKSDLTIFNSIFQKSYSQGKLAILSAKSKIRIEKSNFNDNTLSYVLLLQGNITLKKLFFETPMEFALSTNLQKNCRKCHFKPKFEDENHFSIPKMMIIMYFMVFLFVFILFRKKILISFRRLRNRRHILD